MFLAAFSSFAAAQTNQSPNPLLTRPGWEIGAQLARYHYEEPNIMKLTGSRAGAVGAFTFASADDSYARIDLRSSYGALKYEGSGTLTEIPDWIAEVRAVVGKDFLTSGSVAHSPYVGLGYRFLYNDLRGYTSTNAAGYRRYSEYIYVPVGLTLRISAGNRWVIAPAIEYDFFIRGEQRSMLTDTGLAGYIDVTNTQKNGRGHRASLMFENGHWAFGPWMHYWNIKNSDIQPTGRGFGLEPANWTREYGLEVRYRF